MPLQRDSNGSTLQLMPLGGPGNCLTVAVASGSAAVNLPDSATMVRLICDVDCHVIHTAAGDATAATLTDTPLPSGYEGVFSLPPTTTHRIAAIRGGDTDGTLFILWSD